MTATVATAGYDDDGNMTVYELAPGEQLPPGVHPKPPPGTHPHERALAAHPAPQEVVIVPPPTSPPELFSQPVEALPPTTQNPDTIARQTEQAIVPRSSGHVVDYPVSRGPKRK